MNWISVKYELPDRSKVCLVFDEWRDEIYTAQYFPERGSWYYDTNDRTDDVTHWMDIEKPKYIGRPYSLKGKITYYAETDNLELDECKEALLKLIDLLPGSKYEVDKV